MEAYLREVRLAMETDRERYFREQKERRAGQERERLVASVASGSYQGEAVQAPLPGLGLMAPEPLRRPRLLGREYRVRPLAEGYGERKRSREAAKLLLLAGLPGMVKSAEEYEAEAVEGQERWIKQFREQVAGGWLKVLRWRRTATDEDRRAFAEKWAFLPHTPEYAVDLIRSLSKTRKEVTQH